MSGDSERVGRSSISFKDWRVMTCVVVVAVYLVSLVVFSISENESEGQDGLSILCDELAYGITSEENLEVGVLRHEGTDGISDVNITIKSHVEHNGRTYTVTSIKDGAFNSIKGISSVQIPHTITHIGDNAFYGLSMLESITLPDGLEYLGKGAFNRCSNLSKLVMPISIGTVDKDNKLIFDGCKSLTKVILTPGNGDGYDYESNKSTPWYLSRDVLTSLVLLDGVKSIGTNTFRDCNFFDKLDLPPSLIEIRDNAFRNCKGLSEVEFPAKVAPGEQLITSDLGKSVFEGCNSLDTVKFNEGLRTIGDFAFKGCAISSLIIANSVTSIGKEAFDSCPLSIVFFGVALEHLGKDFMGECVFRDEFHNTIDPTPKNLRGHVVICNPDSNVYYIRA